MKTVNEHARQVYKYMHGAEEARYKTASESAECEAHRLIKERDAEIHAMYAPVVDALKRLDSFCREQFDKVPMPVQQKKQWHDVLAMSQAALAAIKEVKG